MFKPHRRYLGIQGAIPKNRGRLARNIGRMVGESLLTPTDIQRELDRPELREAFVHNVHKYLPGAMGQLGSYLHQPGTRDRIREVLRGLFDRYIEDMRFHERMFARVVMSERRVERVLDTIENDGIDQLALLLDDPGVRDEIARAVTPVVWNKLQEQLPDIVQRVDISSVVERKVMEFSVERVETLIRSVIQNELNMIILSGYVLGAVIGVGTFFMTELLGL